MVAKIKPIAEGGGSATGSEGLVAPLILAFETETPVYPLALTATAGSDTQVLLYLICDGKMKSDGRLEMLFAGEYRLPFLDIVNMSAFNNNDPAIKNERYKDFFPAKKNGYLTKFKGTLKPEEMVKDLYLQKAENDIPYRSKETRLF